MKRQTLINLIKYHMEHNEDAFLSEVIEIAKEFDQSGDDYTAQYIMELISTTNYYVPQTVYKGLKVLEKVD